MSWCQGHPIRSGADRPRPRGRRRNARRIPTARRPARSAAAGFARHGYGRRASARHAPGPAEKCPAHAPEAERDRRFRPAPECRADRQRRESGRARADRRADRQSRRARIAVPRAFSITALFSSTGISTLGERIADPGEIVPPIVIAEDGPNSERSVKPRQFGRPDRIGDSLVRKPVRRDIIAEQNDKIGAQQIGGIDHLPNVRQPHVGSAGVKIGDHRDGQLAANRPARRIERIAGHDEALRLDRRRRTRRSRPRIGQSAPRPRQERGAGSGASAPRALSAREYLLA